MVKFLKTKSLYYDDVNLIASQGKINSRKNVPIEKDRIIVSPMHAIVGETFAIEAAKLGLTVCLHRFGSVDSQCDLYLKAKDISPNIWCAVGTKDLDNRFSKLWKLGCRKFLLDVANGYSESTISALRKMKDMFYSDFIELISGNVHTAAGYLNLDRIMSDSYFSAVRVNIGGGAVCVTTKTVTGFGRGQISEILECHERRIEVGCSSKIIADGGIRHSADAAKAFGAGADYVMMGSYFSKALEAETHILKDGTYWGGASTKQQELCGGVTRHAEGVTLKIENELKPLKNLVEDLWMGLASAVSYSGKTSLTEFIGEGIFELKYNR